MHERGISPERQARIDAKRAARSRFVVCAKCGKHGGTLVKRADKYYCPTCK